MIKGISQVKLHSSSTLYHTHNPSKWSVICHQVPQIIQVVGIIHLTSVSRQDNNCVVFVHNATCWGCSWPRWLWCLLRSMCSSAHSKRVSSSSLETFVLAWLNKFVACMWLKPWSGSVTLCQICMSYYSPAQASLDLRLSLCQARLERKA
jgi:hypothetical protein